MADRQFIGLRTLRGSAFLMPVELLPVVVPATRDRNVRAFAGYLRKHLSGDYEDWVDRVLDVIPVGNRPRRQRSPGGWHRVQRIARTSRTS